MAQSSHELLKTVIKQMPVGHLSSRPAILNADIYTDIPKCLNEWSSKRVVLVASASLAQNTTKVSQLEKLLGPSLVATKLGVGSHSPYADVLDIARLLQSHKADALIVLGSSSYSDASKIARLLATNVAPEKLTIEGMEELVDKKRGRTAPGAFKDPLSIKLILVPCSLSVSEYNPMSSASSPAGKKQHFGEFSQTASAPDLILLDPTLAATAPQSLWLESGCRAVDHCIETYVSKAVADEGLPIALKSLEELIAGLNEYKTLKDQGVGEEDVRFLESISKCQSGARNSFVGIMCYGTKMGPSHATGHQLGSVGKVPHGLTSCICLAATLRWQAKRPQSEFWSVERQADILKVFNGKLGWNETSAGNAVQRFFKSLGMPTTLSEVGVTDEQAIRQIADQTLTDVWGGGMPQMTRAEEVLEMLEPVR